MDLQHLKYFKRTAELEHITQASLDLHIAQPALSKAIKDLETEMGAPLFDRHNRRIHLNENGKILLKYANKIDECIEELHQDLTTNSLHEENHIIILLKSTPIMLPRLIYQFSQENPQVNFRLITYNRTINEQKLEHDFTISASTQEHSPCVGSVQLLDEEMVLAVPLGHPLAGQTVSLAQAAQENFISLPSDYLFYHELIKNCRKAGFTPRITLESSDYYTISGLVEAGEGIAMVPRYSWGIQDRPNLAFASIRSPICRNKIVLSWNNSAALSDSQKAFIQYAIDFFFPVSAEHTDDHSV